MRLKIHADDLGLSKGVNEAILKCIDRGVVNSVSLICNGYDYDFAVTEIKKRPQVSISIHLNFVEGVKLGTIPNPLIRTDQNLIMQGSFFKTLLGYYFASSLKKQEIELAFENEIDAQIKKVVKDLGDVFTLGIDSHQYFHMIPFIFNIVIRKAKENNLKYIRTVNEVILISSLKEFIDSVKNKNIIKWIVLNLLNQYAQSQIKKSGLSSNAFYVGVLFSGKMRLEHLQRFLKKGFDSQNIEFVTHPGKCLSTEEHLWSNRPELLQFISSEDRSLEAQELCSSEFKIFLKNM